MWCDFPSGGPSWLGWANEPVILFGIAALAN
jgi:hypothetical protein